MYNKFTFIGRYILSVLFLFTLSASSGQYYRSKGSGTWNDLTVWETSPTPAFNLDVQPATTIPDYTRQTILIRSGDTIVITNTIEIDEVVIEADAMLVYGNYSNSEIKISDGPGIDLMIDGTFEDSGPYNLNWTSPLASWALGNHATIIRTRSTSAGLLRDHYANGMSTIPSSSNWILRKRTADSPSISGVNSWYGNLKIENATPTFWNANLVGSRITGISSAPVVKGNMEIGTSGLNGLKFYSQNSSVNRMRIEGNLIIGTGSEFHLEDAVTTSGASGIELWGNLEVNGILSYDPTEASDNNRTILFSGGSDQSIAGTGSLSFYNLSNSKLSGDLILQRNSTIDHKLILHEGKVDLNGHTLTILSNAGNAVERNNGWIESESNDFSSVFAWNIGNTSGIYEFPFGKNHEYIPFRISAAPGSLGLVQVATYGTNAHNLPFPVSPQVTNLLVDGLESSASMVDRFWYVRHSGTAQYSFTFASDEYTSTEEVLSAIAYDDIANQWKDPLCCQTQNFVQQQVTVPGAEPNAVWTLTSRNDALQIGMNESLFPEKTMEGNTLRLFPVPFEKELLLCDRQEMEGPVHIELLNPLGQKIFETSLLPETKGCYKIDLSCINEKGVLYIQVSDSFSTKRYKLMRE